MFFCSKIRNWCENRREKREMKRTYRPLRRARSRHGRNIYIRSMTGAIQGNLCSETSLRLQILFSVCITATMKRKGKGEGREPGGGAVGINREEQQGHQDQRNQHARQHKPCPVTTEAWRR